MIPFDYRRAHDVADAVGAARGTAAVAFLAGGTNLVDRMKLGVARPEVLVDISRLPLDAVEELPDGGLRVGATARNSDLAAHPAVRRDYPVLSRALLSGASGQLRNLATTGGNLLQRTRCSYFQDVSTPCNKREPGTGCSALGGFTRQHAVLGASEHCVATHPSDMAVAMAALDAVVRVHGPDGPRAVPLVDLHRLPGDEPHRDTVLSSADLITAVDLPPLPPGTRSAYVKVRDRASFAFALVSVAAVLRVERGVVADARIALGGVAHKPWRARRAEELLRGGPADEDAFRRAAEAELADAAPVGDNAFKVPLARNTVVSALRGLSLEGR
ncbi:xanthine dehydrogenase family protein subunit M [Saccharothrix longispora]|uniref:FAD binding domain-containing protein n=1 Tax=Saccharothrix longispora TaxID=33920 RepID=UPI0028FD046E|nr:xanthine dehydrogenase family protein subunit M [Saccharothrix longispora]MBY8850569.1 xanthine dehydrogenase family protein subunit M [Saccharothrix sp. MB29]MDU0288862.1 xanthine dehydrogenase family protein subunit M [Saccharothrix longispora]